MENSIGGGTVLDFVLDVLLIKPRFSLGWYLNYLLIWYVLFWMVHFAMEQLKVDIQGKAKFIMLLLSIMVGVRFMQNGLQFEQMFSFVFGVICAYECQWLKRFLHFKWIILLFIIAFTLLVAKQMPFIRTIVESGPAFLDLIMKSSAALGIILFYLRTCGFKLWSVIFCYLGSISFELYLVHGVALQIFGTLFTTLMQIILFILISLIGSKSMYLLDTYICGKLKSFAMP